MLTNVRLVGHFTIDGKPLNDLKEEKYEIKSAKKMPEGNAWTIAARIQYAKYDVTVPLVLNIEWAGNTPVLTLDQFTIPGMGTFDARVIFHDASTSGPGLTTMWVGICSVASKRCDSDIPLLG